MACRFTQRLSEIGWIDGSTVRIEVRWAEGRNERAFERAAEFAASKVNVIVTTGTPATAAAKHATTNIPIVFVAVADPVGNGLVADLARPGGNLTGLSNLVGEVAGKRLELLHQAMPDLRHVAIMGNADNPGAVSEMRGAQGAAATLGLEVVMSEIRRAEDIGPSFKALQGRVEAVWVAVDGLTICQSQPHQHLCARCATADQSRHSRIDRPWRSDVLWPKQLRSLSPRSRCCR
jgi:putative tryptophan/tyrosine transport system substrate-binding protein